MIINKVSCDQFAGLTNKELAFNRGMNIILGKNESGKTTMVDLIYSLLLEDNNVSRSSSFVKTYFPRKVHGPAGDFIKGRIGFATENGEYVLTKTWDHGRGEVMLTYPNGSSVRDGETINKTLAEEMVYGRGMYDEVMFASQKRVMTLMQSLFVSGMAKLSKEDREIVGTKTDIASGIANAVAGTGGFHVEKLEKKLQEKLELYGEKWDMELDEPIDGARRRGIKNKWSCATTKLADEGKRALVLRAYYDTEEIVQKQRDAIVAEKAVEAVNARLTYSKKELYEIKTRRENFINVKGNLDNYQNITGRIKDAVESLRTMKADAEKWPKAENAKAKALELENKQKDAKCIELYDSFKSIEDRIEAISQDIAELGSIGDDVINDCRRMGKKIIEHNGKLQGLNLTARMKQLGTQVPEIRGLEDGGVIAAGNIEITIKEAVEILVPGVMELQLAPEGVDVDQIRVELAQVKQAYEKILAEHGVTDEEELLKKKRRIESLENEKSGLEAELRSKFAGIDWDTLEKNRMALGGNVMRFSEVTELIHNLCGEQDLGKFIGAQGAIIDYCSGKYGSIGQLQNLILEKTADMERFQGKLAEAKDVPEEFKKIEDLEDFGAELKEKEEDAEDYIAELRKELSARERQLGEQSAEEYSGQLEEAQEKFKAHKEAYRHWMHIAKVFGKLKEGRNESIGDIENKFRENLELMSEGNIRLRDFNENMDATISSGNNRLDADILSEGTKGTIALALRLAILEYLYPDGGGMAVFDDPFTDMDPERRTRACGLLKRFAENNQVIFATCDEKYLEDLGGNLVEM
ncbi:MAG: AAA family ATPase [Eubacteriales bacterium]|nr:AAA family ATPase [Eubacteriales bacterium]